MLRLCSENLLKRNKVRVKSNKWKFTKLSDLGIPEDSSFEKKLDLGVDNLQKNKEFAAF